VQRRGALARQVDAIHAVNFPAIEEAVAIGVGIPRIGPEPLLDLVGQPVAVAIVDGVADRRV